VPCYGYEWQTTTSDPQAHTFPNSGSTASFKRVQALLQAAQNPEELELDQNITNIEQHWNQDALSPYLTYQLNDKLFVLYYENSRSLSYKLDFVNQLDLAGIAIWALGYEGSSRELWDVINRKL
jgi:spore germination protein YaaH